MTTSAFFETVEKVFFDWNYNHPRILYALMRSLKPEIAVEVGTYRGYAACYMAQALKENGKGHLYCIDDFSEGMQKAYDENHWNTNLMVCEVREQATLIRGKSQTVQWPEKVDFAYIDGWHGYLIAREDFMKAFSRGAEVICFDDVTSTIGVRQLMLDIRAEFKQYFDIVEIFRDCGLAIVVRKKEKPPATFSQEYPNHPGVVLTNMEEEAKIMHIQEAGRVNGRCVTREAL